MEALAGHLVRSNGVSGSPAPVGKKGVSVMNDSMVRLTGAIFNCMRRSYRGQRLVNEVIRCSGTEACGGWPRVPDGGNMRAATAHEFGEMILEVEQAIVNREDSVMRILGDVAKRVEQESERLANAARVARMRGGPKDVAFADALLAAQKLRDVANQGNVDAVPPRG